MHDAGGGIRTPLSVVMSPRYPLFTAQSPLFWFQPKSYMCKKILLRNGVCLQSDSTRLRLDRLDNAFLFVISAIGLLVTIIQGYSRGILGIVELIPILVLGVPLPFYIGYVRGAISLPQNDEAIFERLRGWGYLTFGLGAYISILAPILPSLVPYGLILYLGILFLSAVFAGQIQGWFIRVFNVGRDPKHQISYSGAIASGTCFAVAFGFTIAAFAQFPSLASLDYYASRTVFIFVIIVLAAAGITFEKASRMIASETRSLDEKQVKGVVEGNLIWRLTAGVYTLSGFIFVSCKKSSVLWIVGLMVGLGGSIIQVSPLLKGLSWLTVPITIACFTVTLILILIGIAFFMKTQKLSITTRFEFE